MALQLREFTGFIHLMNAEQQQPSIRWPLNQAVSPPVGCKAASKQYPTSLFIIGWIDFWRCY